MEAAIERIMALAFLVIGLSHVLQPKAWARFFIRLHGWGDTGNFLNAMITLAPGLFIVSMHNVWSGIPTVLTVIGWLYVVKATIYLLVPSFGLRVIGRVTEEKARGFVVAGVMLMAVGGLLTAHLLRTP